MQGVRGRGRFTCVHPHLNPLPSRERKFGENPPTSRERDFIRYCIAKRVIIERDLGFT